MVFKPYHASSFVDDNVKCYFMWKKVWAQYEPKLIRQTKLTMDKNHRKNIEFKNLISLINH